MDARELHEVRAQEAEAHKRPTPDVDVEHLPVKNILDPDVPLEQLCHEHKEVSALITAEGRIRTGLSPADRKKAQEILNRYGVNT